MVTGHGPVLPPGQMPGRQQALGHPEGPGMGEVLILWDTQSEREGSGLWERFLGHAEGWSDLGQGRTQPVRVRRDVRQGLKDGTLLKGRSGS